MEYQTIIDKFYEEDTPLRRILLVHSRAVADKALHICDAHPELQLDRNFVEAAAMLHDIGIIQCDAPGIHCFGTRPYIQHGLAGEEMLLAYCEETENEQEKAVLRKIAHVCSHHTGAGISRDEIVRQHLDLPLGDYLPVTIEEKVICYADKFYSKTHLEIEKDKEHVERSIAKFGEAGLLRFREWDKLFG